MSVAGLVFGVLETPTASADPLLAETYRGLTISWSRYGYHDVIIEDTSVDAILGQATERGSRYCLVQPYGHVIHERWTPDGSDFFDALQARIEGDEFLVIGHIIGDAFSWYGYQLGCLLVDLERYRQLGSPRFEDSPNEALQLPSVVPVTEAGDCITSLVPAEGNLRQTPRLPGWQFIATSLNAGLPVQALGHDLEHHTLNLEPTSPARCRAFSAYLGGHICEFSAADGDPELSADQSTLLRAVTAQTANARRGVFLWNIESYADTEQPRPDFVAPVSSLYSVAAGFKPNRILHTHGFVQASRVVYFDYSPNALDVKRCMVQEWDGQDFPQFIKYLFKVFPHPETFYQLWRELTPDQVDSSELDAMWERELARWGGGQAFRKHWLAYRELVHEYVCCDLLADASPLLAKIDDDPSSILWWSNAFFTMYGNWYFSWDERQRSYEQWIQQIADKNPQLYLFGSDYINSNVNYIRAGEYWEQYRESGPSYLTPCNLYKTGIRM